VEVFTPETARLFPMDDVVLHEDVAGAACGGGVAGSPWWNVEPPYTPIGCECALVSERGEIYRTEATSPESPAH